MADDERLGFSVMDDGSGIRGATPKAGGGLLNVADRMRAVAAELRVESSASGTTVSGSVPLDLRQAAPLTDTPRSSSEAVSTGTP